MRVALGMVLDNVLKVWTFQIIGQYDKAVDEVGEVAQVGNSLDTVLIITIAIFKDSAS